MSDMARVSFCRKPSNLQEVCDGLYVEKEVEVEVQASVVLCQEDYDSFSSNFLNASLPCQTQYFRVQCCSRPTLIVNTEGYNYARYVGLEN